MVEEVRSEVNDGVEGVGVGEVKGVEIAGAGDVLVGVGL